MAIIILPSIFGCNGCKSLCAGGSSQYAFAGGSANISPGKDSIQVGDTLWFSSIIPTKLQPIQNGQPVGNLIDFSGGTNVITDIHFSSLLALNMQSDAVDSFFFEPPIKGSVQTNQLAPHFAKTITYSEENGNYISSFRFIAQKEGVYCITIIDIFKAEKKCDDASIEILIKNTSAHLNYLQDIYYGGGQIDSYSQTHSYCFKVY